MLAKILTTTTALALAASLSSGASADDDRKWYLGGSIGYNQTSNQTSEGENHLVEAEFDAGITTSSVIGYNLSDDIRFEGEFAWRRNDGDAVAFNGIDRDFNAKGAESYSLLANVFYDFENGSKVTPYIGAGAGIGFLENDFRYGPAVFVDKDTAFVYQGIIGASLPITERIVGFVDARFLGSTGVDFERISPADNGVLLDSEYDNFSVSVGYRWKL